MLKLFRVLFFFAFVIFVSILAVAFINHKLLQIYKAIPTSIAITISFLSFYLLPVFIERLESPISLRDEPRHTDLKRCLAEKDKQLRKAKLIISSIGTCLVTWEESNGRISAEATLVALKRELMKLQGMS